MTKVNLVPLIDVCLVLVVILLITAPVMAIPTFGINLPLAHTQGAEDDLRVTVSLGPQGELAVDDKLVAPEAFKAMLRGRIAETKADVLVAVRADASVPYQDVAAIVRLARESGAQRIAIATSQGDEVLDGGLAAEQPEAPTEVSRPEDLR